MAPGMNVVRWRLPRQVTASLVPPGPGAALKDDHPLRLRRLAVFNHDSAAALARKLTLMSNDGGWATMVSYYYQRALNRLRPDLPRSKSSGGNDDAG